MNHKRNKQKQKKLNIKIFMLRSLSSFVSFVVQNQLNFIPKEDGIEEQLVCSKPCAAEIGVVDKVNYPSLTDWRNQNTGTLLDFFKVC